MQRTRILKVLNLEQEQDPVFIKGWVRTKRDSKGFSFLEINDGSCLQNIQVVVDWSCDCSDLLRKITTGASVAIEGKLVESPGKGQRWEVQARKIELLGAADPETYPLQKKRHSDEFLRTIAELRPRTNKYGALNRIRSEMAYAIHKYFHDQGFLYIHTPIITASDCEGAGELFRVTSLDLNNLPPKEKIEEEDFFGKKALLTVSGQLTAEAMACALGNVYTFGPTFRAENSNTPRHAAEFWMVEPEVAFADLEEILDLAEDFVRWLVSYINQNCSNDLALFSKFVDKELQGNLSLVEENDFVRLSYSQAIEILQKAEQKKKFEYQPYFGADLQTEHERYLVEKHFQLPIIVYNYPQEIKPFYMRLNDDKATVSAMDVLLPKVGEIIGGSQREERIEVLLDRMHQMGLKEDDYRWYVNLRRFGTVPHAGFGLGFERMLMFMTGVHNIRDVLPFPRTPRQLEF